MQNNSHYAIQGHHHRFWYKSKPHTRVPISD